MSPSPLHALSFDVEEYFQVSNFAASVPRSAWTVLPSRIEQEVEKLLRILDEHGVRATFFVLGWVAQRHRTMIEALARDGHEIAAHGWDHQLVHDLGRHAFRDDVRRTKGVLEDITGVCVLGYRAPSFTITHRTPWALDVLAQEGYRYDASIFPVHHPLYGMPDAPRELRREQVGGDLGIVEFPPLTVRIGRTNLAAGGGAYFRLLPLPLTLWALRRALSEGVPVSLYLHPWELDPEQPHLPVGLVQTLRHRVGLGSTERRLRALLRDHRFAPMKVVIADVLGSPLPLDESPSGKGVRRP